MLRSRLRNKSWRRVPFSQLQADEVPRTPGVYVFCAQASHLRDSNILRRLYTALYIGRANSLRRRFSEHLVGYSQIPLAVEIFGTLDFWYLEAPRGEIGPLEDLLVNTLGPRINRISVRACIHPPVPAGSLS
jgi:excinuclease UvrABC nuclease subunit